MNPFIATVVYVCGIAGLFFLDRDKSVRTSKALWLPVIYIWVLGSRPVSVWLGISAPGTGDVQLEGSPVDRAFFLVLLIVALSIVIQRGQAALAPLAANWPILFYFGFCLFSVIWSDFPGVAFKRWIKATTDIVMILIVVTDKQPVAALRRLFARTAFILIPLSLLFIKYYPNLGRSYDAWTGAQMNNGLTLNKNLLGLITFVLLLGAVWSVLVLIQDKEFPDRRRHLLAQCALLGLGINLLLMANSATSTLCFAIGTGLMFATSLQFMRRRPGAVHALVLLLVLGTGSLILLGGGATAAQALGRNATLTGRTEIWADVLPLAQNPLVGAGFESFWLSPVVHARLAELIPGLPLNEAHNGYIEVYLELGWVGLSLIALILLNGYRRSVAAYRREPALGALFLAYILTATTYNITEAGFRSLDSMWVFLLLAVLEASAVAAGVRVRPTQPPAAPADYRGELRGRNVLGVRPRDTAYHGRIVG